MNKILKIGAVIAAAFIISANTAKAGWGAATFWFNTTNALTATAGTNSGWPTNIAGVGDGQAVNISQFDTLMLDFQGLLYSTNAVTGAITINLTLLTSDAGPGGPQVVSGTNIYSAATTNQYNDWVTTTNNTGTMVFSFVVPTGQTNGWIHFQTNLVNTSFVGPASWLGIYSLTATGLGTGGLITNNGTSQNGLVSVTGKQVVRPISN